MNPPPPPNRTTTETFCRPKTASVFSVFSPLSSDLGNKQGFGAPAASLSLGKE
ncbi:UNVERIFIED_CONTAM: hypothetical protein K2H54_067300, partial [Gekko kuhli]